MEEMNLHRQADTVNELLARYGVKFGIYKNGTFREQLFPFDAIPRVIEAEEFESLERGLKQRVMALNCFIRDIYGEKKIVRDKVVPEEFVYASSGYLAQCEGVLLCRVTAPTDGWLFKIREYPVVDQGSLLARILRREEAHTDEV